MGNCQKLNKIKNIKKKIRLIFELQKQLKYAFKYKKYEKYFNYALIIKNLKYLNYFFLSDKKIN